MFFEKDCPEKLDAILQRMETTSRMKEFYDADSRFL